MVHTIAARFGAEYLHVPESGLSRARNVGFQRARQDVVAFIDDDAIAAVGWLAGLLGPFGDANTTFVTGSCIPIPESGTEALRAAMSTWWKAAPDVQVVDQATPEWLALAIEGAVGTGGNMAIRRESAWWNGFDVRLGRGAHITGYEEHEAIVAHLLHGHRVAYTPEAVVTHPVPETEEAYVRMRDENRSAYVGYLLLLFAKYPETRGTLRRMVTGKVRRPRNPDAASAISPSPLGIVTAVVKGTTLFLLASLS